MNLLLPLPFFPRRIRHGLSRRVDGERNQRDEHAGKSEIRNPQSEKFSHCSCLFACGTGVGTMAAVESGGAVSGAAVLRSGLVSNCSIGLSLYTFCINSSHVGRAALPPVSLSPRVIFSSKPIQTPATNDGV